MRRRFGQIGACLAGSEGEGAPPIDPTDRAVEANFLIGMLDTRSFVTRRHRGADSENPAKRTNGWAGLKPLSLLPLLTNRAS